MRKVRILGILGILRIWGEERTNVGINVGTNVGANEERALAILSSTPTITAKEMAQVLGITTRQGERILAVLKQKNLIRREGATKNGRWIVIRWNYHYLCDRLGDNRRPPPSVIKGNPVRVRDSARYCKRFQGRRNSTTTTACGREGLPPSA